MMSESLWATFCGTAERSPDVAAILSPARQPLRFGDLPARLEAVRDDLARLGIGRGDRVASVLRRGPETAVCHLGVSMCAMCMPMDPDFSEAEFTRYLTQLRPAAMIVAEGHSRAARACATALGIRVIDLVSRSSDPAGTFSLVSPEGLDGPRRVGQWNTAEDMALVLLTSGSTAAPKAVPLRVRHLIAYARVFGDHYALSAHDRCLHVMPMFHGHGVKSGIIVSLLNGSGVIASPGFDVPTFFQQMQSMRPTWYSAGSSIQQAILARIDDYRDIARDAQLRFIRSGSGRLDPRVMAGLEQAFGAPVLERYGMSETGNLAANPLPPGIRKPGSVGPRAGNEIAIIDESGQVLGSNRQGEVVARGASVFDGYLDNPEATQAAFLNGWFRTGDLGYFDDDGYLILTGRLKDVINRGGEKIGTAEVEAALLRHPAVLEACAFGLPHPSLGEDVAAAVSIQQPVSPQELQTFVGSFLTGIKVPRRVFVLPSLPRGSTNKIRRAEIVARCLEMLEKSRLEAEDVSSRSWSPLERELAAVWKRLLGVDEIKRDDDFFLLGGDSLSAAELLARLQRTYRIALDLAEIFGGASTVTGMARLIERSRDDSSKKPKELRGVMTIKATGTRPPLFVVPGTTGNPAGFIHLARLLDTRQPVVGIESRGLDGIESPLTRMEDIAADNIARMQKVQAKGPYFLAGHCFGGRVAYEMARQLEASGEAVGMLFMLDASAPFFDRNGRRRGERRGPRKTSRWGFFARYAYGRITKHLLSLIAMRGSERRAFLREKAWALRTKVETGDIFRVDPARFARRAVSAANRRAGRNYVPRAFGGPAVLCMPRDREMPRERNFRLDWLTFVPQIGDPTYIGGRESGEMMVPPHVYELADAVNRQLEAAHAKDHSALQYGAHGVESRVLVAIGQSGA